MEEQLSIPLTNDQTNNQANNQENLVVQQNQLILPKREKILLRFYSFDSCIWIIKVFWYILLWFICLVGSSFNYNYYTHTNNVEEKYFTQFHIFVFPNLILSFIIVCCGAYFFRFRLKILLIINLILIPGKILLFIFFYKAQKKIFHNGSEKTMPKISMGIEATYISVIIILEIIKIIIIR